NPPHASQNERGIKAHARPEGNRGGDLHPMHTQIMCNHRGLAQRPANHEGRINTPIAPSASAWLAHEDIVRASTQ
ncbi:uncharacterized protein METZ01_LOCUS494680, partial [marine metagenome]